MRFFEEYVHGHYVHSRRARVLSGHLAQVIPPHARVLDVGCGDGLLAAQVARRRPDIRLSGIDVAVRPNTHVPVEPFDGEVLPYPDGSFDVVLFVDVLHHTADPMALLREARRVAGRGIVIKDHTLTGVFAGTTLRFMDRVANTRHGVTLPFNYWPRQRWDAAFAELGLTVGVWRSRLGIYPAALSWLFERSLHFVARLDVPPAARAKATGGPVP
jgi:SAM-dependent methyltransferase